MKKFLFILLALAMSAFVLFTPVTEVSAQTDAEVSVDDFDWDAWEAEFDAAYEESYDDSYDYTYEADELTEEEAAAAVLFAGVYLVVMLMFVTIGYVYMGITLMTIAKKLDHESPWLAWIPVANYYLMAKLAGLSGWTMLLIFIPFVNIIYMVYLWMKISEKRGFEQWLGILILVPLAQLVVPGYLAWGEPKEATEN